MVQNKALSEENLQSLNMKKNNAKLLRENNYLLKENNNLSQKLKEIHIPNIIGKRAKSPTYNNEYQKYKFNAKSNQNKSNMTKDKFPANKTSYNYNNYKKMKIQNKLNNMKDSTK